MHSPEPWLLQRSVNLHDGQHRIIHEIGDTSYVTCIDLENCSQEDAERIVACVNFCNGLSNDTLTRFGEGKERCPAVVWAHVLARSCAAALVNQLWPDCEGFVDGIVKLDPRRSGACDDVQKSRPQQESRHDL